MSGQGAPNLPGLSNAGVIPNTAQQKPKFNFNSRDVKSEITPDFMAAQLASFGSSAKLKTLPAQSNPVQSNQYMQPMFPQQHQQLQGQNMMYQQPYNNQGLQQPMMNQMSYQGFGMSSSTMSGMPAMQRQAVPNNMYNFQGNFQSNMQMNTPNQSMFNNNQFGNQQSMQNLYQTMPVGATVMSGHQVRPQSQPTVQPNQGFSQSPSHSRNNSSPGRNFDVFNTGTKPPQQKAQKGSMENDPFLNLRAANKCPQGTPMLQKSDSKSSALSPLSSTPVLAKPVPSIPARPFNQSGTDLFGSAPFSPSTELGKPSVSVPPQPQLFGFESEFNPSPTPKTAPTPQSHQVDFFGQAPFDPPPTNQGINKQSTVANKPQTSHILLSGPPQKNRVDLSGTSHTSQKHQIPQQVDLFGSTSFDVDALSPATGSATPKPSQPNKYSVFAESSPSLEVDKFDVFSSLRPSSTPPVDITQNLSPYQGQSTGSAPKDGFDAFLDPRYSVAQPPNSKQPDSHGTTVSKPVVQDSFDPFGSGTAPTASDAAAEFQSLDIFGHQKQSTKKTENLDIFGERSFEPDVSKSPAPSTTFRERPSSKTPTTMILLPGSSKMPSKPKVPVLPPRTHSQPSSDAVHRSGTASSEDLFQKEKSGFDPFGMATEPDGAMPSKEVRHVAPLQPPRSYSTLGQGKKAPPPPPRLTSKRPAPPPPSRPSVPAQSNFFVRETPASLLDTDFAPATPATPHTQPPPQPLLILPASDPRKSGPPGRPPPPKGEGAGTADKFAVFNQDTLSNATSLFAGMPPPLAPRPGPGHVLYHYIVKTGPHAIALFDFEAENTDELDFKVGDLIKILADISDDWYEGSVDAKNGIFPKNLVDLKRGLLPQSAPYTAPTVAPPTDMLNAWKNTGSPPSPPTTPVFEHSPLTSSVFESSINWGKATSLSPTSPTPVSPTTPGTVTPGAVTPGTVTPGDLGMCTAVYEFAADQQDELSIKEGDRIIILEYPDDDWIKGRIAYKTGIFPKAFVTIDGEVQSDVPPRPTTEELNAVGDEADVIDHEKRELRVYADFYPEADDELDIKEGDMVHVISMVDSDWLRGRCGENEGIFPASFVPSIPSSWNIASDVDYSSSVADSYGTADDTSGSSDDTTSDIASVISEPTSHISEEDTENLGRAQVIADFEAENDFEMSLRTGDIVNVTARLNDIWLEGECSGAAGIFPNNFVKWLDGEAHVTEPAFAANPLLDGEIPKVLRREETLTALTPLSRDVTINTFDADLTPRKHEIENATALASPSFSISNPFAEDTAVPNSAELTTDLNQTLKSPSENPFTSFDNQFCSSFSGGSESQFSVDDLFAKADPFTAGISAGSFNKSVVPGAMYEMRAVYAFEPGNDDELAFEEGDVIQVVEYLNEDWLKGSCKGKVGLFPAAFAEKIQ